MATDQAAILAALQAQLTGVNAQLAAYDMPAEESRFTTAEIDWAEANRVHQRKTRRWTDIQTVVRRKAEIEAQIVDFTP